MHAQQRHARFNLMVALSAAIPAVLCYSILLAVSVPKVAIASFAFFGIFLILINRNCFIVSN